LVEAWQKYDVGIHVLLGTFTDDGKALLYLVAQMESFDQQLHRVFGDAVIGEAGYGASFWLRFRQQASGLSTQQSAYHAYEAARLAGGSSSNSTLEMIVATTTKAFHLTHKHPEVKESPVSLRELERMLERYGPHSTERDLGHDPNLLAASEGKSK